MGITEQFLELLWVTSYYLAGFSILVFLLMAFLRVISDRRNLERVKRMRTLKHQLFSHIDKPETEIKKIIKLRQGDKDILIKILHESADFISPADKEVLLRFMTELGIYKKAIANLRHWRLPKRLVAIRTLCHWTDDKTKRYLVPFLNSDTDLIKATVIDTLARMRAIEQLPRVVAIAEKLEILSQPMLADIFTKFGSEAAPSYVTIASDAKLPLRIRLAAILALGNLKPLGVVDMLLPHMEDKEFEIRANILRIFEHINDPKIIPAISRGLADESWIVRLRAAYCAKKMPSETFIPLLRNCLSDKNWLVEQRAIEALFMLKENAEIKMFLENLAKENTLSGKHTAILLQQGNVND